MRVRRAMTGRRAAGDPTDAEVWLRLFESAIAQGKAPAEAAQVADVGGLAFRKRFLVGQQAVAAHEESG